MTIIVLLWLVTTNLLNQVGAIGSPGSADAWMVVVAFVLAVAHDVREYVRSK